MNTLLENCYFKDNIIMQVWKDDSTNKIEFSFFSFDVKYVNDLKKLQEFIQTIIDKYESN